MSTVTHHVDQNRSMSAKGTDEGRGNICLDMILTRSLSDFKMSGGNVVRIGDSVSCGDHSAEGSSNVFANGIPITHQGKPKTTGHSCFPPSVFIGPWTTTVFVNNQLVALNGVSKIKVHCCKGCHDGIASTSSENVGFNA